tara:strand:+ start:96 stop:1259 length:1164 start_codon:yes stop_codon:yes gene_type:complete
MNSTRRNFLSFLSATTLFSALPSFLRAKALQAKYLILVELRGANDGLNTVIPYTDKYYYRLRPNIAIPKKTILSITKNTGLHYRMEGVAKLFEKGECKIIQNLGYPNPVLSHFRSIELWEKGGDGQSSKKSERGWLVDPISTIASKQNLDAKGIYLDNSGEIFSGDSGFLGPNVIDYEPEISEPRDATVPIPRNFSLGLLDKIVNLKKTNAEKLLKIKEKYDKIKWINTLGVGSLGSQLTNVCRLIEAEIDVPVFKVSIGSFDTHANQLATHELLLREFDRSIYATVEFLKSREVWDNTIIMTYSEFGRRAKENGSSGTDHGMAAPHFVLGGKIKGGIDGGRPNLSKLDKNNLVFSVDYRTLYDYVLSSHFGLSENPFKSYRNSIIS